MSRLQTPSRSRLASAIASAFARVGARVDVEHAAALGVGERAHAVLGREPGELRRRLAAAAQDHERDQPRQRDEQRGRPRGRASGRARPRRPAGRRPRARAAARRRRARSPSAARRRPCAGRAVFRLFSSWPATSSATFGRASKFAPTMPIGIRRSLTRRPFGSVHAAPSRSSGSSSAVACELRRERRRPARRRAAAGRAAPRRADPPPPRRRPRSRPGSRAPLARRARPRAAAPRRRRRPSAATRPRARRAPPARPARQELTSFRILAPSSGQRPAPHRERLRDRPCEASATCLHGKVPNPDGMSSETKERPVACYRTSLSNLRHRARARGRRHLLALLRSPRSRLRLGRAVERAFTPRGDRGRACVDLALRAAAPRGGAGRAAARAGLDAARPGAAPGGGSSASASSGSSSTRPIRRTRSRTASSPSRARRRRSSG